MAHGYALDVRMLRNAAVVGGGWVGVLLVLFGPLLLVPLIGVELHLSGNADAFLLFPCAVSVRAPGAPREGGAGRPATRVAGRVRPAHGGTTHSQTPSLQARHRRPVAHPAAIDCGSL